MKWFKSKVQPRADSQKQMRDPRQAYHPHTVRGDLYCPKRMMSDTNRTPSMLPKRVSKSHKSRGRKGVNQMRKKTGDETRRKLSITSRGLRNELGKEHQIETLD